MYSHPVNFQLLAVLLLTILTYVQPISALRGPDCIFMSIKETIDSHVDSQSEFGEDFLVSPSMMDLNTLGDISPDAL
jgi:hypothetical protein